MVGSLWLSHIIHYFWPPPQGQMKLTITSQGLGFQDTTLPNVAIIQAFYSWVSVVSIKALFASDASKDDCKISVAAIDVSTGNSIAGLIPHVNSIISAEANALPLALTSFPTHDPDIYISSDSLSVLNTLKNWSFKSPIIILHIIQNIQKLNDKGHVIHLIWCPGHRGIPSQ